MREVIRWRTEMGESESPIVRAVATVMPPRWRAEVMGTAPPAARTMPASPRPPGPGEQACEACGEPFTKGNYRRKRFCSDRCRLHARHVRRTPVIVSRHCDLCGSEFTSPYTQRFCTARCRNRWRHARDAGQPKPS